MSDISKLIEALRVGEAGGARGGEADPILPLDRPLAWVDGKLVRAPDAPKVQADAPKAAESARTPAEGASPGPRQAEGAAGNKK